MVLIVFDIKGIPATRRERIVSAVEAGGKHLPESYEAWITMDSPRLNDASPDHRALGLSAQSILHWTRIRLRSRRM
jgi:hypothetical protein